MINQNRLKETQSIFEFCRTADEQFICLHVNSPERPLQHGSSLTLWNNTTGEKWLKKKKKREKSERWCNIQKMHLVIVTNTDGNCEVVYKGLCAENPSEITKQRKPFLQGPNNRQAASTWWDVEQQQRPNIHCQQHSQPR